MCLALARFAEEVAVEHLQNGILVRLADRQIPVNLVECLHALLLDGVRRADGLAAAADAAAWAGHDLDEVIGRDALADLLHENLRVLERVRDCDVQRMAANLERALLDALEAARLLEVEPLERLARQLVADRAQGGLHDAARRAENRAGARGRAERAVEVRLRQLAEGEADVFDELDELARRQHDVDILPALAAHLRARSLELLRRARHDGHRHDVLGVDAGRFRVVRLGDGAEDAHRRFRRGEMGQAVAVVLLDVADPARAARGHHRQHPAMLQAVEEFRAFLHDREVGAEVRVEDLVKAEEVQRRDHLACHDGAWLHAEGIAEGDAYRRRDLHDDVLLRILQRVEHFFRIVFLDERARRADEAALTAEDAVRRLHRLVVGRRDDDVAAAPRIRQRRDALHILAGADAAAAADALRRVTHDGGIRHDARLLLADGRQ